MPNPYDFNTPAPDSLFVGRSEIVTKIADALTASARISYGVVGGRRCGKSSLLEALLRALTHRASASGSHDLRVIPVFVSMKSMDAPASPPDAFGFLLHEIRRALCGTKYRPPRVDLGLPRYLMGAPEAIAFVQFRDVLEDIIAQVPNPMRIALVIDEMDEALGHTWTATFFGNLRSLIYDPSEIRESIRIVLAGSGRYLEVDEKGSRLINALKAHFLEPLSDAAIRDLVTRGSSLDSPAVEAIVAEVGGSPFLTQFILHHMCDEGLVGESVSGVKAGVQRFCRDRSQDLEGWWCAIGRDGRVVYRHLLQSADEWTRRVEIYGAMAPAGVRVDRGLLALLCHGLIAARNGYSEYRVAGRLFRNWSDGRADSSLQSYDAAQRKEIEVALLSALPKKDDWDRLIRYSADDPLDTTAFGSNLAAIATTIVGLALSQGWVDRLIVEARTMNPENPLLRYLAGVPTDRSSPEAPPTLHLPIRVAMPTLQTDVLLVTVTKLETRALLEALNTPSPPAQHIDGRVYFDLGEIHGARVRLTRSEMGTSTLGGAQQTIAKAISALSPQAIIMVGIAFGIDDQKQQIGDILISEQLRLYDLARIGTTATNQPSITLRGDKPHAAPSLINLYKSADLSWKGATTRFGPLLTGDKLIDNRDYRAELRALEPEAIGGEMEGAGLYVACHEAKVDWILIKAICDWADGNKAQDKDARQALAARNAAEFALHGLRLVSIAGSSSRKAAPRPPEPAPAPPRRAWPTKLTGPELKQLADALLSAYPTRSALAQMLSYRLTQNLDALTAERGNLGTTIFELLTTAEAQGWIPQLFDAALAHAPGNPALLALAAK